MAGEMEKQAEKLKMELEEELKTSAQKEERMGDQVKPGLLVSEVEESGLLFQIESGIYSVYVFDIEKKKLWTFDLSFKLPTGMGLCQVFNHLYAGGGRGLQFQ